VEKYGILQPILLRSLPDGDYELIAGKSRLEEVIAQGKEDIEAIILDTSEKDSLMMHIAENLARGETDPISTAQVLKRSIEAGASEEEIARATGHTVEWVRFYITLTELPPIYQEALREGKLNVSHIRYAAHLEDPQEISAALNTAITLGWPASVLEKYVESRLAEIEKSRLEGEGGVSPPPPPPEKAQEIVRYSECSLCRRKVSSKDIRLPGICPDCIEVSQWLFSQLGEPHQAAQRVYEAISYYQNALRYQQMIALQMAQQPQPPQPPSPGMPPSPGFPFTGLSQPPK